MWHTVEDELKHDRVQTNGIWMHIVEQGEGPLYMVFQNFGSLGVTRFLAWPKMATMFAPDMRGYGDTHSPLDPASYTVFHLVGDLIGLLNHFGEQGDTHSPLDPASYTVFHLVGDLISLLNHFGEQQAFVVGHDWGAEVAWHLSLLRPDRVRALVTLGVPLWPRSPTSKPIESLTKALGEGLYLSQFQEPGRAEKVFARYEYLTVMKKFLLYNKEDFLIAPPGMEIIDSLETPSTLPPWITEDELQVALWKAISGRRNWELLAPWQGSKIDVPSKFIVGDKDIGFQSYGTKIYVEGEVFKRRVPNLEVAIITGGHHFIQQEKAYQVTNEIVSFIRKFPSDE
ncbi:hypothetical protein IFM89_004269 [Coptis chinensis]|uniref:AB hydrolase-1 domain-containing protein n=1 Tax=Coptis chinensis TaxID=261450 RepID=A0A835I9M4_9MAGN|nr:hypothetical protein IFM89_004269 [Coptis chinensis]